MPPTNFHNTYLKTQVETAPKEQLVVMLFDGIIRFTDLAKKAMGAGDIENTHHNIMRAQAIVMELIYTVDRDNGGEIAKNLLALHAYAFNCLIHANMSHLPEKIDEVQKIYRELREGWLVAMKSNGITSTGNQAEDAAKVSITAPAAPAPTMVTVAPAPSEAPPAPPKGSAYPKPNTYGMGKTTSFSSTVPNKGGIIPNIQRQLVAAYAAPGLSMA